MGTHMIVLSESSPMNTNMVVFKWLSKNLIGDISWKMTETLVYGYSSESSQREL